MTLPPKYLSILPKKYTVLSHSEVGSRMWGMHDEHSDYDVITVYAEDTKRILSGYSITTNLPQYQAVKGKYDIDEQYFEISHLINLICKGNCNAIWAVTTPIVYDNLPIFGEIRNAIWGKCTVSMYPSIFGMAVSQWADAEKRKDVKSPLKSKSTAMRTLQYGRNLLEKKRNVFDPVVIRDYTLDEFDATFMALNNDVSLSDIPDKLDEEPFRDILMDYRVDQLDS
jgi:predicted nucleotidyltransferase